MITTYTDIFFTQRLLLDKYLLPIIIYSLNMDFNLVSNPYQLLLCYSFSTDIAIALGLPFSSQNLIQLIKNVCVSI